MRHLRENVCLQPRAQAPPDGPPRRAALQVHALLGDVQFEEGPGSAYQVPRRLAAAAVARAVNVVVGSISRIRSDSSIGRRGAATCQPEFTLRRRCGHGKRKTRATINQNEPTIAASDHESDGGAPRSAVPSRTASAERQAVPDAAPNALDDAERDGERRRAEIPRRARLVRLSPLQGAGGLDGPEERAAALARPPAAAEGRPGSAESAADAPADPRVGGGGGHSALAAPAARAAGDERRVLGRPERGNARRSAAQELAIPRPGVVRVAALVHLVLAAAARDRSVGRQFVGRHARHVCDPLRSPVERRVAVPPARLFGVSCLRAHHRLRRVSLSKEHSRLFRCNACAGKMQALKNAALTV